MADRLMRTIAALLTAMAAVAIAAMMTILTWQVVARYALGASPPWAEQAALVLMIWMTFLGAAAGIADGFHIRIVEGISMLPDRWRGPVVRLSDTMILVAGVAITWFGLQLVESTWGNTVPTLPVSRGMVYSVIPVSGALMALFALRNLWRSERGLESVSAA